MREYAWFGIFLGLLAAVLLASNDNSSAFRPDWYDDSTLVAQRDGGNFISGDGITVTGVDDAGNSQVDFTLDLDDCAASEVLKRNAGDTAWTCQADATGAGGSAIILDLADDDANESTDLTEIAITGDTNSIFTEPTPDKLLIALANNWPTADAADALSANPSDCGANTFAQSIVASGNLTCAAVDLGTADVTGTLDVSDHLNLTAGDHITITGDDLDVDDDFILNTGVR